jgi:hypothetical protein
LWNVDFFFVFSLTFFLFCFIFFLLLFLSYSRSITLEGVVLYSILFEGCLMSGRKLFHKKGNEQFLLFYFVCLGGPNKYWFFFILYVDFGCYMCIPIVFVGWEVVNSIEAGS